MTSDQKRARGRLIRRRHRLMKGLPLRRNLGGGGGGRRRARSDDDSIEERDLDTPNPDLIGFTEERL